MLFSSFGFLTKQCENMNTEYRIFIFEEGGEMI